jgi:hypothetical protein
MTLSFAFTLFGLGSLGAFVAGLLGIGGAIVMIPLLLYVPPWLGVGHLTVKAVTGEGAMRYGFAIDQRERLGGRAGTQRPRRRPRAFTPDASACPREAR